MLGSEDTVPEHSPFCASEQTTFGSITGAIALPCDCGVLAAATPISIPEPDPEPRPEVVPPTLSSVLAQGSTGEPTTIVVAAPEAVKTIATAAVTAPEMPKTNEIPVDTASPLDSVLDVSAPATQAPAPAPDPAPAAEEPKKKRAPRKKKEPAPAAPATEAPKTEAPKTETPPAVAEAPKVDAAPVVEPPKAEESKSEHGLFDAMEEIAKLPPITEEEAEKDYEVPDSAQRSHVGFPVAPQKLEALYVGIDIGLQGYITELGPDGQIVAFHPMPTSGGEKPVYDEPGIARILAGLPLKAKRVHVMLEQQQTIGKLFRDGKEVRIGSKAHFKKGMGYGILRGVLATVQRFFPTALSYDEVSAKTWKKAMGISGGSPDDVKKKAITKTGGLYPGLDLRAIERAPKSRVPSGDKAESVLISRYVWLMTTGALKLLARGGEPTEDELAAREKLIEEEAEAANQDPSSASDSPPNTDEGNAKWLASMTRLMTNTGGGTGASAPKKSARNTKRPKPPKATAKPKRKKSDPGTDGLQDLLSGI